MCAKIKSNLFSLTSFSIVESSKGKNILCDSGSSIESVKFNNLLVLKKSLAVEDPSKFHREKKLVNKLFLKPFR